MSAVAVVSEGIIVNTFASKLGAGELSRLKLGDHVTSPQLQLATYKQLARNELASTLSLQRVQQDSSQMRRALPAKRISTFILDPRWSSVAVQPDAQVWDQAVQFNYVATALHACTAR